MEKQQRPLCWRGDNQGRAAGDGLRGHGATVSPGTLSEMGSFHGSSGVIWPGMLSLVPSGCSVENRLQGARVESGRAVWRPMQESRGDQRRSGQILDISEVRAPRIC